MIAEVSYISFSPNRFIPKDVLTSQPPEKVWLSINYGKKPPTPCEEVLSDYTKLGLDGQCFKLRLGNKIEIVQHDILSINDYNMYVHNILD